MARARTHEPSLLQRALQLSPRHPVAARRPSSERRAGNLDRYSHNPGFTLIEMLVVMMIIGVTLAVVSVNFSRDERAVLETEAQRLALLFEQARDEAVTSARAFAWSSEAGSYRFWQRNLDAKWTVAEDELFRPRGLTAPVKVANLSINEAKAPLNGRIVFLPSGFNAPFALVLAAGKERATVGGDAGGRISIRLADANK